MGRRIRPDQEDSVVKVGRVSIFSIYTENFSAATNLYTRQYSESKSVGGYAPS